jgi:hypothetical protein
VILVTAVGPALPLPDRMRALTNALLQVVCLLQQRLRSFAETLCQVRHPMLLHMWRGFHAAVARHDVQSLIAEQDGKLRMRWNGGAEDGRALGIPPQANFRRGRSDDAHPEALAPHLLKLIATLATPLLLS